MIFGIGMPAKIAFGAIHGDVPVAIFTLGACNNVPPILFRAASAMRLTRWDTIRSVRLPATLPIRSLPRRRAAPPPRPAA